MQKYTLLLSTGEFEDGDVYVAVKLDKPINEITPDQAKTLLQSLESSILIKQKK